MDERMDGGDGCMGGWRDAAPAPTRGAQAAARVSWGSWSSSAGVGWVFRGRGGHCGTAAPSVTGAAGSSGGVGEGQPPPERPGRGTAHRLRDPPASAAGTWRPARGWHGAPAGTRTPAPGRPPAPANAASDLPGAAGAGGFPRACGRGEPRGLPGEGTRPPARHCTPLPGVFPAGPGAGGPRGHRRFLFLPAPREGGGDGVAARKDTERGSPVVGLPRLPGAATTEPPAPGTPRRR